MKVVITKSGRASAFGMGRASSRALRVSAARAAGFRRGATQRSTTSCRGRALR
jgi:hypothetical protein